MAFNYEYLGKVDNKHYIKFWTDFGDFTRIYEGNISDIPSLINQIKPKLINIYNTYQTFKGLEGSSNTYNGVTYTLLDVRHIRGLIFLYLRFDYNNNTYYRKYDMELSETVTEVNNKIKNKIDSLLGV